MKEITKEELEVDMDSIQKDKNLESYGQPIEFYFGFFDLIGEDLLLVVEESGKASRAINSTFLAMIPKKDASKSFNNFRPILLCNVM
jgi:hypothetical protein